MFTSNKAHKVHSQIYQLKQRCKIDISSYIDSCIFYQHIKVITVLKVLESIFCTECAGNRSWLVCLAL